MQDCQNNHCKCLIMGLGNIGRIHAKYLTKNGIDWRWYDPFANGPKDKKSDLTDMESFHYVFITSPENMHFDNYKQVRDLGYDGPIFIEKPAALTTENVDEILKDDNVFIGMVERFNPAVQTLKNAINKDNVINIDFSRCCVSTDSSSVSIFEDIGIHDIDLLFFLLDLEEVRDYHIMSEDQTTIFTSSKPLARMIWSKDTFFKERKIIVRQSDCTYEVDLQEQAVVKHWESDGGHHISQSLFVEKSSPIDNEQKMFFNGDTVSCAGSHKLLLELIDKQ